MKELIEAYLVAEKEHKEARDRWHEYIKLPAKKYVKAKGIRLRDEAEKLERKVIELEKQIDEELNAEYYYRLDDSKVVVTDSGGYVSVLREWRQDV